MVPIIEPEVLMDGNHSAKDCLKKTSEVLKKCYEELELNNVDLKGTILKPNMILPGTNSDEKLSDKEVAEMTLECLKIMCLHRFRYSFSLGGQTEIEATAILIK